MFFILIVDLADEFEAEMTRILNNFIIWLLKVQLNDFSELGLILNIAALVALEEIANGGSWAFLGACRHRQNTVSFNEEISVSWRALEPRVVVAFSERVEALLG